MNMNNKNGTTADIIAKQKKAQVDIFFNKTLPDKMSEYVGAFERYLDTLPLESKKTESAWIASVKQGRIGDCDVTVETRKSYPDVSILSQGYDVNTVTIESAGKPTFEMVIIDSFGYSGLARVEQKDSTFRKLMSGGIVLKSDGIGLRTNEMGTWYNPCAGVQIKGEEVIEKTSGGVTAEHMEKAQVAAKQIDAKLAEVLAGFPKGWPTLEQSIKPLVPTK